MLASFLLPIVYQWDKYEEMHFMQGETPPHFALTVRGWLDNHILGLWTGRQGPT
jgi:hypothetical protein